MIQNDFIIKSKHLVVRFLTVWTWSFLFFSYSRAQQPTAFTVALEPITIAGLPGLHSYNFSQHNGHWLIIGGRKDGLHIPQPGAFPANMRNDSIYVVNPGTQEVWSAGLTALPDSIRDQLSSTNANFITHNGYLFITGGYGFSTVANMKITFPYLTAIRIDSLINAVINGTSILPWIKTISSDYFKVTGGRLNFMYGHYYLVFGHLFDGEVSPIPIISGDTVYWQAYTYAIKKFDINVDLNSLSFSPISEWVDSAAMRRRDYNLVKQIFPDRSIGLTAFSGVFPIEFVGTPYLEPIDIDTSGFTVVNAFQQKLNHYHCANIPIYDSLANAMHTVFFGGVAQYIVDSTGAIVEDESFPFVKTIARVTRNQNGVMEEVKLAPELPALLGSGSEFIINENLTLIENEIIDINKIADDISVAGYIVGGVIASQPYAMSNNPDANSHAEQTIYKVKLIKGNALGEKPIHFDESEMLHLALYPNPGKGLVTVSFFLKQKSDVIISVISEQGKSEKEINLSRTEKGNTTYQLDLSDRKGKFFIRVKTKDFIASKKLIVE